MARAVGDLRVPPGTPSGPGLLPSAWSLFFQHIVQRLRVFLGDTGSGGTIGLVPAPAAGDAAAGKYLKADGTFDVPPGAGAGTVTHTGTLTDHAVIVGNGGVDVSALGSLGTTTTVLHGNASADPTFGAVVEADITLANNTTNNVTIAAHGFTPILPNDATKFLNGVGAYAVPAGTSTGTVTHTGTLTANHLIVGNGTADVTALGSLGTTTTLLHGNAAGAPTFGAVTEGDLSLSNVTTANVTTSAHGLTPILPNDATKYLDGTGAYTVPPGTGSGTVTHTGALTANQLVLGNGTADVTALGSLGTTTTVYHGNAGGAGSFGAVVEADITLANNTTNNVSTTKHGFAPILPNVATQYLDGTGAYSVPAGSGGGVLSVEVTPFTDAQIKLFNTTPGVILTAPGAGKAKIPTAVLYNYNFSAGAYSDVTAHTQYSGSSQDICIIFSNTFNQTAARSTLLIPSNQGLVNASGALTANNALVIATSANPTGGNAANSMQAVVTYVLVTLL